MCQVCKYMNDKKIFPVLLGADLNCYNVARAFHEEYGVRSYAFGKYAIGATKHTRILTFTEIDYGDNDEQLLTLLESFADEHNDGIRIILGCTDEYAAFISKYRKRLGKRYIVPYIPYEQMAYLTLKANFYKLCEKYGILYPKTVVYSKGDSIDSLPFDYPIIIKASSSVMYWQHPFEGMKKCYRAGNREEVEKILADIYAAGYLDKVIIQDTIPGDDSQMYVLTCYSDGEGRVRMSCLGHVLLEEHTPKGLGNHCAIITESNPELVEGFVALLEGEGYTGFSNFDIKYDHRDGSYRAFEINTRQGRSNYYVTASGHNIARYLVQDRVYNAPYTGRVDNVNEIYWRYVPDDVVLGYMNDEIKTRILRLKSQRKAYSSMRYKYDLCFNPLRYAFVITHEYHHRKKFATYYRKEDMNP